jgi:ethanolamine ammonia-lyase large subunit
MDPEKIILDLSNELSAAIVKMSEAKDVAEKEAYSRVVKNLTDSLGVFFNLATDMMPYDYDDDFDDVDNEDFPF